MEIGVVKWFNNAKGFGFISAEGVDTDIFAHYVSVDSPLYGRFNNERYPPARILIIYNVPYPRRKNRL